MSLQNLLGRDTITVYEPTVIKDASGGNTSAHPLKFSFIPARVRALGSVQMIQFGTVVLECTDMIYTTKAGIENGDLVKTSDSRLCRVQGITRRYGINGIETHFEIGCLQVRNK